MGTNYYAIPKLTNDLQIKMIKAVIENQMNELRLMARDYIHIGKSSAGWPFLFNHNNWEHYNSVKDLGDWLDKCEIVDEYNRVVDIKLFKEIVEDKQKFGINKFTESEHASYYIIKDGYAFSTSTEFS